MQSKPIPEEGLEILTGNAKQGTMIVEASKISESSASSIRERAIADNMPLFLYSELQAAYKKVKKGKKIRPLDFPDYESNVASRELTNLGKFCLNSDIELIRLYKDFVNNSYSPMPYIGFTVRKKKKKKRPILSPNPRDRVVYSALLKKIKPDFSFMSDLNILGSGTNNRLNSPTLIFEDINQNLRNYNYILKIDIQNFFPSIRKDDLLKKIEPIVTDKRAFKLIKDSYYNGICFIDPDDNKYFNDPKGNIGIPQGCAHSPLMANFYFCEIDLWLRREKILAYRYLDDLLILCPTRSEAEYIFSQIERKAHVLGLIVHPLGGEKSYILKKTKRFEYLGVEILNDRLHIPESQIIKFYNHITLNICSKETIGKFGFLRVKKALEFFLNGWKKYYQNVTPHGYALVGNEINLRLTKHYIKVFPRNYLGLYIDDNKLYL